MRLADKHCSDINKKNPPLGKMKMREYLSQLNEEWKIIGGKKIKRVFKFGDYLSSVEFVNKLARLAEKENHHPDIYIFYEKVEIVLSTHAVAGLSENDFILATKIDKF